MISRGRRRPECSGLVARPRDPVTTHDRLQLAVAPSSPRPRPTGNACTGWDKAAAEIATFAERRLLAALTSIATAEPASPSPESSERITAAYLDGWAIVDAIDRLCRLSRQLNSNDPAGVGAGLDARLQGVRNIRNVADHLERRVEYVYARPWGSFTVCANLASMKSTRS